MAFWKKLFGDENDTVDYYREGLELLKAGKYHEALTSLRLALRDAPGDVAVLQQIAIAYTRIGMTDEAIKTYRLVLEHDPAASGAHYGLAFLLLRAGQREPAEQHLRAFLASPPDDVEAVRHITHAKQTLKDLQPGAPVEGEG
ncbi:MAG TPA: tetratricopeptide repeat protein [Longimicrobiales bacterium]|nr:tetratricopeptide repeat protein [Longimicrobiales bacterium]